MRNRLAKNIAVAVMSVSLAGLTACEVPEESGASSAQDGKSGTKSKQKANKGSSESKKSSSDDDEKNLSASQGQAVVAAKGYLEMGTGFSRAGLIEQLTSEYGNGFNKADATFAVNYLKPNWNKQAVIAAEGYLDMGTGFSRSGLIEQLTSPAGNQFTQAEAQYAADQVGL